MGAILALLKSVFVNPSFESSAIAMIEGIGKQILAGSSEPDSLKQLGTTLITDAASVVGSLVANTPAAGTVSAGTAAAAAAAAGQ